MSLTPEEKRDLECEKRGDFRHCDPSVSYQELDAIRDAEDAGRDGKDVHTEHCCIHHGCKYGKDDCLVETGQKEQSFPCEACGFYEFRMEQHLKAIKEAAEAYQKDSINALDKPSSWQKLSELLRLATIKVEEDR